MSNKLVSINEFIKRQTKNSGKTYTTLSFKDLAEYAEKLSMEDQVVRACRENLVVWESYLSGIAAAGDAEDAATVV
mgnify:CR=1 FL=1